MTKFHKNQSGLVAITVTMIIMFILTLIVLSFAQVVRREQRQALDRQLNTQAFYAAESGVNDAKKALRDGHFLTERTDCSDPLPAGFSNQIEGTFITYSCLLVDPSPISLEYTDVGLVESQVFPIKSKNSGQPLSEITFYWQGKETSSSDYNAADCPAVGSTPFPATSSLGSCSTGILRVDLVPYSSSQSRDQLVAATFTAFLYPQPPQAGGGSVSYAGNTGLAGQGVIETGDCSAASTPKACHVTIQLPGSDHTYYARIRSIYKPSTVSVSAQSGGVAVELADAQAIIDSTGKANDILRRIQVRTPITTFGPFPEFAVQTTTGQCKRYSVIPSANQVMISTSDPNCAIE